MTTMTRAQFQEHLGRINGWLLILLAFFLPLSTSVVSVTAMLFLAGWLLEGNFKRKYEEITVNPLICMRLNVADGRKNEIQQKNISISSGCCAYFFYNRLQSEYHNE